MSQLVAWQFVSPEPPDDVSAQDRYRRRQRRARLASDAEPELVEGYTVVGDLSSMQQPHLLTPAGGDANVILHVTHTLPDCPVPPLLLAADLAEHGGPRELIRARELIREALT